MDDELEIEGQELELEVLDTRGTALHCATAIYCTWVSSRAGSWQSGIAKDVTDLAERFEQWLERE